MSIRRLLVIVGVLSAALAWPACAPEARHRVLTFFFDGVPEPGAEPTVGYDSPFTALADGEAGPGQKREPVRSFSHTPFRENRCRSCHDLSTGGVLRTDREGLCAGCHQELNNQLPYVHGPVAINACQDCHHAHASAYPSILLDEAEVLCQQCHALAGLITCEISGAEEAQPCLECHAAHGGNNRFFLKRGES